MPGWETRIIGLVIGGRPRPAQGDDITGALSIISTVHHEVHEGETFQASYKSPEGADLADNANLDMLLITGARYPHFTYTVACGGDAELLIYRDTTVSNNGTGVPARNMKHTAPMMVAGVTAFHTPTVTLVGTQYLNALVPGGTGGNSSGGTDREDTERILALNTNYLIRLINRSGNASPASIIAQWYEEADN